MILQAARFLHSCHHQLRLVIRLHTHAPCDDHGAPPRDPAQLWAEASAPVMYWDSVFSADKTVSLAHATPIPVPTY